MHTCVYTYRPINKLSFNYVIAIIIIYTVNMLL